jgi:hypothetical protein
MEFNINNYFLTNLKLQIKFINESDFTRTEKMYYLLGYKASLIALKDIQKENFNNIFKTIDDEINNIIGEIAKYGE